MAESASLYSPSVDFGDVVLPEAISSKLLRMLESHAQVPRASSPPRLPRTTPVVGAPPPSPSPLARTPPLEPPPPLPSPPLRHRPPRRGARAQLRAYNKRVGLSKAIPQPDGLVLLLCGPSGAGKTMTANAVARKMGKKLLLVNFPMLAHSGGARGGGGGSSVQSIFREAELANAVVFFDECESLFSKRGHGDPPPPHTHTLHPDLASSRAALPRPRPTPPSSALAAISPRSRQAAPRR